MTTETRYENPRVYTNWSGGKAYSWSCQDRCYSASEWTAEVTFKRKPKPLRVNDKVKLRDSILYANLRGKICAINADWAWVVWDYGGSNTYPETISLKNLARAED